MCQSRPAMSIRRLAHAILGPCLFLAASTANGSAPPTPSPAAECRAAARIAAERIGVPETVLVAISLTETGRKRDGRFDPWPWTVNMEGKGVWFPSRAEAEAYATRHHANGARSFDVGCFQLNWKWHGKAFASIPAMFDPVANATYAATFLLSLFQETGSWDAAAGAYHSRTPKYATRYATRFARIHATLDGRTLADLPPTAPSAAAAAPRINAYPLLQAAADAARTRGSLVALGPRATAALIDRRATPLF
jgi:hypothetical protein